MAGTSSGGKQAAAHRDRNELRQAGSKGGQHSHSGGRSNGNSKKTEAGRKGGERSGSGRD